MAEKDNFFRRFTDKAFGGIRMSWIKVTILAVASALVTAVFMIVPIFENTSFVNMGTYFEMWVFLAVLIMVNCSSPLDSALKTFVFFLISQPLIYLFQVPFSALGWELFTYYRYWLIWTLATFPMAYAGWYLKKRNWLSLLILSPALVWLAVEGAGYLKTAVSWFPHHLLSAIFCFGQIILYLYVFFRDYRQRFLGAAVALIAGVICFVMNAGVDVGVRMPLPDEPHFSQQAVIAFEDSSYGDAEIINPAGGYVYVHMTKTGSARFTVTDGDRTYTYRAETVMENGNYHIDITPITDQQEARN